MDVPRTANQWRAEIAKTNKLTNLATVHITDVDGSASTVTYGDWLYFKAIWDVKERTLDHATLFGREEGRNRESKSLKLLRTVSTWWDLIDKETTNTKPWEWGAMAAWKQSVDDIMARKANVMELELSPGAIYDDSDVFRLYIEPSVASRAHPRQHHLPADRNYGESGSEVGESDRGSSRSSHSLERECKSRSSSVSQYVDSQEDQGSAEGRPRSRAPSSTGSDGFTARIINKHRPDEALINMSLILLLQGVATVLHMAHGPAREGYNWSILHKRFSITQPGEQTDPTTPATPRNILIAKTDGCLQFTTPHGGPDDNVVLGIIEVKPFLRSTKAKTAIRIQESAEMAAWISTESSKGNLANTPDGIYR